MKRHPALVPLSHDHHHGLVQARRLRAAADGADQIAAATAFLRFFAGETREHFRDEEERLFPAFAESEQARDHLLRALLEHQRIHALAGRLAAQVEAGAVEPPLVHELGDLVEAHIRFEERELFPLLEQLRPDLALLPGGDGAGTDQPIEGRGPVWGAESEELNATLLEWSPGGGAPSHVNDDRDVLVAVLAGSATVTVDGRPHDLGPGEPLLVAKGASRQIMAGPDGVRYLSVHRRRGPMQLAPRRPSSSPQAAPNY